MSTSLVSTLAAAGLIVAGSAACGGSGAVGDDDDTVDARPGTDAGSDGGTPGSLATHFASQADNWPVPPSGLIDGFDQQASAGGVRWWATYDLDGDGRLDLVQTGDTTVTQRVWDAAGTPHWKLFRGQAGGWSTTATDWPVPGSGRSDGFFAAAATGSGYEWRTFDLDGDGRPDLIHTVDPSTGKVWDAAGTPHWKLFRGRSGGGFDTTAVVWSVPASGTPNGFHAARNYGTGWVWDTFDVDRDGKPDLVQTTDPATTTVWDQTGAAHWKVFVNTGDGFATTPLVWSVPASGTTGGFRYPTWTSGSAVWTTADLDGDRIPDLIQTADPSTGRVWDASGAPYWKVFAGGASGFAASPIQWRVPPSGLVDGFDTASSSAPYRRWRLVDLDGDRRLDLVQTGDTAHDSRVWDATGTPYWKLYVNRGDRFETQVARWSVPSAGVSTGFHLADSASGSSHWFVADADHDGHVDLIQTMDPATGRVWDATGAPYWKVFRGQR